MVFKKIARLTDPMIILQGTMAAIPVRCITILLTSFWIEQTNAAPLLPHSSAVIPDWTQYNYLEPEGAGTYAFGYDVEDPETNNIQYRSEQRYANGTITGSYGYLEPDGNIHMVHYVADKDGYRAKVEDSARGGMLKPIPVLNNANYITYGYSPQMLAAIKSQQIYKQQKVHEERVRPYDQLEEEQKLQFQPKSEKLNEKSISTQGAKHQNKLLLQKLQQPFTVHPYFNYYTHLGNKEKIEDKLDFLDFA